MLTKNINFKNFKLKSKNKSLLKNLKILLKENNQIIKSLSPSYKNNYNKKTILKYKKFYDIRIIGMGGSTLGTESIYDFLKHKIKKKLTFYDNLTPNLKTLSKKKNLNLIVSKSGNTIETITNVNLILKKNNDKSIFITENKKSYLLNMFCGLNDVLVYNDN